MAENNVQTLTTESILKHLPTLSLSQDTTTMRSDLKSLNQNVMCIWFHDNNLPENIHRQMKIHLNKTFYYTQKFTNIKDFTTYLHRELIAKKVVFIIISDQSAKSLCGIAKKRQQCLRVYELRLKHDLLASTNSQTWPILDCIDELFAQVSKDNKTINDQHEQLTVDTENDIVEESSSFRVYNSDLKQRSFRYLSIESLKFLLFQSCIEVLIKMQHDSDALHDMLRYCRSHYMKNSTELKKIDTFRQNYSSKEAIRYYTRDSFIYRKVNEAFRCENIERIFKFRYYITDLHQQLGELAKTNESNINQSPIRLSRGKKLLITHLQQLNDNKNKLISINGFFSTTRDKNVALVYAGVDAYRDAYESALFELIIDETRAITRPFADIAELSVFQIENEVLFSAGSVWRLEMMEKIENSYWTIILRLCNDLDLQLIEITNLINGFPFLFMGNVLRELGEYSNAKNFYGRMLEDPSFPNGIRALAYYNIALLADEQGEYMDAIKNYHEAENLIQPTPIPIDKKPSAFRSLSAYSRLPSKLRIFNQMGLSYQKKGDYKRACTYFMKAIEERDDPVDKATVHNNFGLLEFDQGNYEQARYHFTQAVELAKHHLLVKEFKQNLNIVNQHFFKEVDLEFS